MRLFHDLIYRRRVFKDCQGVTVGFRMAHFYIPFLKKNLFSFIIYFIKIKITFFYLIIYIKGLGQTNIQTLFKFELKNLQTFPLHIYFYHKPVLRQIRLMTDKLKKKIKPINIPTHIPL